MGADSADMLADEVGGERGHDDYSLNVATLPMAAKRAGYGKALLQALSTRLSAVYGDGFSVSALKYIRLFYLAYPELLPIRHSARDAQDAAIDIGHALRDNWPQTRRGGPVPCTPSYPGRITARC